MTSPPEEPPQTPASTSTSAVALTTTAPPPDVDAWREAAALVARAAPAARERRVLVVLVPPVSFATGTFFGFLFDIDGSPVVGGLGMAAVLGVVVLPAAVLGGIADWFKLRRACREAALRFDVVRRAVKLARKGASPEEAVRAAAAGDPVGTRRVDRRAARSSPKEATRG